MWGLIATGFFAEREAMSAVYSPAQYVENFVVFTGEME
jgi:hypothetical protein